MVIHQMKKITPIKRLGQNYLKDKNIIDKIVREIDPGNDDQVIEIRKGAASFDPKLDALAKFTKSVVENRGKATQEAKDAFFSAGYTEANLIDVVIVVGDKVISNYIHNLTGFEIDFPIAPELALETV